MQIKKIIGLVLGLLLIVVLLCQRQSFDRQGPLAEKEKNFFLGQKAASLQEKPQRIVAMSPCNTEILFALGAGDRVVGVTSFSDYPVEAQAIPSIGPYNSPDIEKVVELSPDIVFAIGRLQIRCLQALEQAGIQVIAVDPQTLPEILTAVDLISERIGEPEKGLVLHKKLAQKLEMIEQRIQATANKRVFIEMWDIPLLTVGRRSFIQDLIIRAGGINVAAGSDIDYVPCDIETLYSYDPETYVVLSHSKNDLHSIISKKELFDITAVKNNMVFQIQDDIITRPGPRCFDGLQELARILHPELMRDL